MGIIIFFGMQFVLLILVMKIIKKTFKVLIFMSFIRNTSQQFAVFS